MTLNSSHSRTRIPILGSQYNMLSFQEVRDSIIQAAKAQESGYVCISNVHTTMMGVWDSKYREITNNSFFSVPDGQPVRWAMQLLGSIRQERVRGPSLMKAICDHGRKFGLKHYLYGASEPTLASLTESLLRNYPGIEIVGAESPPYRPITEQELAASIARIHESGAEIVWVGLGAPKQEIWMWEQRQRVRPIMMGIGAAFDLLAGRIPEAPAPLQALGLEWAYRLWKEPKRLWRRYVFNNPAFIFLFVIQLLKARILRIGHKGFSPHEKP